MLKKLETVQMTGAEIILGCSKTTSGALLRAGLGMYPRKQRHEETKLATQRKEYDKDEIAGYVIGRYRGK